MAAFSAGTRTLFKAVTSFDDDDGLVSCELARGKLFALLKAEAVGD